MMRIINGNHEPEKEDSSDEDESIGDDEMDEVTIEENTGPNDSEK